MRALAKLKQDLELIKNLGGVIDTFETAALLQFRLFQSKDRLNTDFIKELKEAFDLSLTRNISSPYFATGSNLPQALVIITSDEGFLGELNTLCINAGLERKNSGNDEIIILGEKGARYLEDIGMNFMFFPGISESIASEEAGRIVNYLLKGYGRRFGSVTVVYPEFLSLTSQRVSIFPILPYSISGQKRRGESSQRDILVEPSQEETAAALIDLWMNYKFLEIFCSAKQAELAARIMHLEGSTQELELINKKAIFSYFKQVHALSDKTIREISATKILLKKRMGVS